MNHESVVLSRIVLRRDKVEVVDSVGSTDDSTNLKGHRLSRSGDVICRILDACGDCVVVSNRGQLLKRQVPPDVVVWQFR